MTSALLPNNTGEKATLTKTSFSPEKSSMLNPSIKEVNLHSMHVYTLHQHQLCWDSADFYHLESEAELFQCMPVPLGGFLACSLCLAVLYIALIIFLMGVFLYACSSWYSWCVFCAQKLKTILKYKEEDDIISVLSVLLMKELPVNIPLSFQSLSAQHRGRKGNVKLCFFLPRLKLKQEVL